MSNVQTIAITEELEVKCIASVMGGDSVEKLQIRGAAGYIRRANSAMNDSLRKRYLMKALEILENK
ncbi:hypothetical protein AB9B37_19910 [Escherichia coli]|nr:MAG TPA: hypothetical protein [Caudoviricetes sp.]